MSSWGCTKCVKKIISLILSLAICAAMLPAAFAANEDLVFRDARSDFAAEFTDKMCIRDRQIADGLFFENWWMPGKNFFAQSL